MIVTKKKSQSRLPDSKKLPGHLLGATVFPLFLAVDMTSGELLAVEPQELKFPFKLKKQLSCSLQLSNKTDNYVAFKVKTTNPKKYCVLPNTGIVLPRSISDVIVTMKGQKEAPPDMQCKDKFLLLSVIANPGATARDMNREMFNKESGNLVEECKLRVAYVSPPQPPSPVPKEELEEGSSPRSSLLGNETSSNLPTVIKGKLVNCDIKENQGQSFLLNLLSGMRKLIGYENKRRRENPQSQSQSQGVHNFKVMGKDSHGRVRTMGPGVTSSRLWPPEHVHQERVENDQLRRVLELVEQQRMMIEQQRMMIEQQQKMMAEQERLNQLLRGLGPLFGNNDMVQTLLTNIQGLQALSLAPTPTPAPAASSPPPQSYGLFDSLLDY